MKRTTAESILIGLLATSLLVSLGIYFKKSFENTYHNFKFAEVPSQ